MENIRSVDFIEKPFDDELMVYNYNENRYVLTPSGALQSNLDLEVVFKNETILGQYLDLLSRSLYSFFLFNKDSKYHNLQLWNLSHSKQFRKAIYKIYTDAVWYNFKSGGFMVAYQSGINLNEMKQLDITMNTVVSIIGRSMAVNMGIMERIPRLNGTISYSYETLDDLKVKLVELGLYTGEQLENVTSITQIDSKKGYLITYNSIDEVYMIRDSNFWTKQLKLQGQEW